MTHYFININGNQSGPFTLDEIKTKRISAKTQMWKTGLAEWKPAVEFEELKLFVVATPPPIVKKIVTNSPKKKYDDRYEKPIFALFLGVLLLIFNLVAYFLVPYKEDSIPIVVVIVLIIRIIVTIWVVSIAQDQNRHRTQVIWGIFAFVWPVSALIVIGLTKKKWIEPPTLSKSYLSDNSPYEKKRNTNNPTFAEWRTKNPRKSVNDYYAEINNSNKK